MRIYLVRHGESEDSKNGLHQRPDTPLSAKGRLQSELVANILNDYRIDLILTSPLLRAQQTAEIINKYLRVPLKVTENLEEEKRPSVVQGKGLEDEEAKKIISEIEENYSEDYKHSDEDSFEDLKNRGLNAIEELTELDLNNILIVGHGNLSNMLIAGMLFGDKLTPTLYLTISKFLDMSNTGMSVFEYTKENGWKLITWNAINHLRN